MTSSRHLWDAFVPLIGRADHRFDFSLGNAHKQTHNKKSLAPRLNSTTATERRAQSLLYCTANHSDLASCACVEAGPTRSALYCCSGLASCFRRQSGSSCTSPTIKLARCCSTATALRHPLPAVATTRRSTAATGAPTALRPTFPTSPLRASYPASPARACARDR